MFGSIGMPELVIILVIALIIFGPRKLPELGRSLGKSIGEFKKASNELRNTLEEEIRVEEQKEQRAEDARPSRTSAIDRAQPSPTPAPRRPVAARRRRHGQPYRHRHLGVGRPWPSCRFRARRPRPPPRRRPRLGRRRAVDADGGGKMSFLEHLDELRQAHHLGASSPSSSASSIAASSSANLRLRHGADAALLPPGQQADLHGADRSVHAVHQDRA